EQFALIPNVGDFVDIPGDDPGMRNVPLKGRVRSRLFKYVMNYCYITIVVEDSDDDWTKLRAKAADNYRPRDFCSASSAATWSGCAATALRASDSAARAFSLSPNTA